MYKYNNNNKQGENLFRLILDNLVNKLDPQINPIYSQSLSLILINNIIESGGTGLGKITVILDLVQV